MSRGGRTPAPAAGADTGANDQGLGTASGDEGQSLGSVEQQVADLLRSARAGRAAPSSDASRQSGTQSPAGGEPSDDDLVLEALEERRDPAGDRAGSERPETLDQVAERLGLKIEDLYALRIGMPGGAEPMTLGEMKDAVGTAKVDELERLDWERTRDETRTRLTQDAAKLQQIFAMLPAQARTPEMVAAAQEQIEHARQHEAALLLQRVPEWRDATRYAADREVMLPHLERWGFTASDLDGVYDHRLLAYVRDTALREQRLEGALAKIRERRSGKGSPATAPAANGRQSNSSATRASGLRAQEAAVARLLESARK